MYSSINVYLGSGDQGKRLRELIRQTSTNLNMSEGDFCRQAILAKVEKGKEVKPNESRPKET